MTDVTPEIIDVDKEHPLPAGTVMRVYYFELDANEAIASYLRTFGRMPAVVYRLRKQAFIPEPEG